MRFLSQYAASWFRCQSCGLVGAGFEQPQVRTIASFRGLEIGTKWLSAVPDCFLLSPMRTWRHIVADPIIMNSEREVMEVLDLVALIWFFLCTVGYTHGSNYWARTRPCLSNTLDLYRGDWMRRMLMRDARIADASVVGNLERNGAFLRQVVC